MALINTSVFNFSAEEIRDINELILEEILQAPELSVLHTIYPGVVTNKYIGFLGEGGIIGLPAQGCDPTPQQWKIEGEQKMWEPKRWEVFLTECWADLENTMAIYAMNKGVDVGDLTNTDYMAVVVDILSKAIKKMIWRFCWFGDKNAGNYNGQPAGIITNGVNTDYFQLIDGFWKQLQAAAPSGSKQRITIEANTKADQDLQYDALTGQMAYDTLSKMHLAAPVVLRSQNDLMFACTQSMVDGYMQYLEGKDIECTYVNLTEGVKALSFRGIPVVAFPIWDEMIQSYENNGIKLNNPHRAVLTAKSNLAIGVAENSVLDEIKVWYEPKEDRCYMRSRDSIDAKVLQEKMFTLAI